MQNSKTMQSEMGGYISTVMREHFGKGPTSVFVVVKPPFVIVHLRGFLSPTEKILLQKDEFKRVMEIRHLLIDELKPAICDTLSRASGQKVDALYSDWHLENQTGMLVGVMTEADTSVDFDCPPEINQEALHAAVVKASRKAEKKPESTTLFWLNDRTLLIERTGFLVEIERELIRNGLSEELKQVKRPLEKRLLMKETEFTQLLKRNVREIFLDWEFSTDISYILVLLDRKNHE
ncbi:MAG: Na-translocating system protein MpsC family protein [Bacillota bacterium]